MLTKRETHMFLILALVVAVLLGVFYFLKEGAAPVPRVQETENVRVEEDKERTVTGVIIPEDVYTYVGQVTDAQPDYILVSAQSHNNYLIADTALKARFDESTVFERYSFQRVIPAGADPSERIREIISPSEITVGDMVTVTSLENTRGKTEFLASKIVVNSPL